MWQVVNHTPFETAGYFLRDAHGVEHWMVAMRLTLDLPSAGLPLLAEPQQPVSLLPVFDASGEEMLEGSDLVPFRPHCDILLRGTATPQRDRPVLSFPVSLSVGRSERTIHCHGPRRLVRTRFGHRTEALGHAADPPLAWRQATGGRDVAADSDQEGAAHPDNPIGTGWSADPGRMNRGDEIMLAPLDDTSHLGARPASLPEPVGLGAIAPFWHSRRKLAGSYDEHWARTRCPLPPTDFYPAFHQSAPVGQRADLRGGEPVQVRNAGGGPSLELRVPQIISEVRTRIGHATLTSRMRLITFAIDAQDRRATLVWNTAVPCPGQDDRLSESTVLLSPAAGLVMACRPASRALVPSPLWAAACGRLSLPWTTARLG
ncbi:hypothetical protein SAMN04487972_14713 [Paracoccus halophilus]|uniref:DUF2169 domain-containing protein n=1 Tax=Paracoccus halophilus TaxID=376733 RepID=A0A1I0UEG2_9RHOB|nr:DUF2169 domain-containing protein [Paracoccus halophilus]SFA62320.1 hypothetical protein SAMN04487972_14713 [Paracoccus halophilus]